jgi:LysM repeat protein
MKLIACLLLLTFSSTMLLQAIPPDSSRFKWIKGEKFLLHKVVPKETWTSIARKYDLEMEDVMKANQGVIDLKIGQIINIPVKQNNKPGPSENQSKTNGLQGNSSAVFHTVKQGETLFSISKTYQVTADEIRKWNGIEGNHLKSGQPIIVGYASAPAPQEWQRKTENTAVVKMEKKQPSAAEKNMASVPETKSADPANKPEKPLLASIEKGGMPLPEPVITSREISKSGGKILSQVSESGICAWIPDGDENSSRYYALHRTAPVGTIIKVTNKMNGKSVFVKVLGSLPDSGENEKIIIKISNMAAQRLSALDQHFQVDLSYGLLK